MYTGSEDHDSKRVSGYTFHSMYLPSVLGAGWPAAGPGQSEVTGDEIEMTSPASPGETLTLTDTLF